MLPYYPFFWGDYFSKTASLTQTQHGAFMLFLRHIYGTGQVIEDRRRYHVAMAFTDDEKESADYVLKNFFKESLKDGLKVWHNEKCEEVIKKADELHAKKVAGGSAGGIKRAENAKNNSSTPSSTPSENAKDSFKQPKTQNPKPYTQTPAPVMRGLGFKSFGEVVGGVGKMLKVIDVTGQLSGADIIEVQKVANGFDIEFLAKVYVDGINSGKREAPNSIPKAFPKWCAKYAVKKGL
ncbi:MAG: DUF1376 domain-containing protein [Rickettsiales bacterium]|nr:DUF1376 domain-containing protein [Rickettsiales bacterium]